MFDYGLIATQLKGRLMMSLMIKKTLATLLAIQATHALAGSGNLFNVTTGGAVLAQTVSYTLCLSINGKNPLSCQNYSTSQAGLLIKTTAPNHTYHYAGIKINTPGYAYTAAQGLRRSAASKTNVAAAGYTAIGTVSDTQAATGMIISTSALTYTNIYVETYNGLVTYSTDNGANWAVMLSPQGGWYWTHETWATATTTDGTMYQATGVQGDGTAGNGAATLIYSTDGITWQQVHNTLPSTNNADWVQSVFAVGDTVYVGTGEGYVYYTSNQGQTWGPNTPAAPDGSTVNAIVVDANGVFYAGTNNGNIYSSSNSGGTWTILANLPTGGGAISSLAIDTNGTLYAVTANTTIQPQYNVSPLTTGTWQSMGALPGGDGNASTIAATGTTVYVGTANSHLMYTSDQGQTWAGNQILNDISGTASLFVTQNTLSPLFVQSYGVMQLASSQGTSTVTVKNLSGTTVSNVHADSTQLPAEVTQTSTPCASVASGGTCRITFAANGTNGFTPTAFNIIDGNENTISRAALVSSITPNGGTNYYYVYSVNNRTASVVDDTNAMDSPKIWSATNDNIAGITDNDTVADGDACNGATDGSCDTTQIVNQYVTPYTNYAAGLCYDNTHGGAMGTGQWYLPSACELNGSIYLNVTTNQFVSCSPVLTSFSSLYSLGALGSPLSTLLSSDVYWSSTEDSANSQDSAYDMGFFPGGGGFLDRALKGSQKSVRCFQAVTI